MIRFRQIANVIAGGTPAITLASDFHWPEFRMDTSPVSVPDWNGMVAKVSAWIDSATDEIWAVVAIAGLVASVFGYARALSEVKAGRLIVYRDWGEFLRSSAWLVLLPMGYGMLTEPTLGFVWRVLGLGALGYGFVCLWQMITGAFRYNSGGRCWLALFARLAVTLLLIASLAKLHEKLDNYRHGRYGYGPSAVVRGVLIPLALFAWVFHALVQPMIGTRYYRLRRAREGL